MKRVFFDTSLCIDIAKCRKGITADDWENVRNYVKGKCRYFISPLTLGELIVGLINSTEQSFSEDVDPIRILALQSSPNFFEYPLQFLADRLFGKRLPLDARISDNFSSWLSSVLSSTTKSELEKKLNLAQFSKEIRATEDQFADNCETEREEMIESMQLTDFEERWAGGFLKIIQVPLTAVNCNTLVTGASAAYFMERNLRETARNRNFQKTRTELIDAQQLAYLCDPTVHMVTSDVRLKKWISRSPQAERVMCYEDLRVLARSA